MWNYNAKVMDHFLHPRNVGELADADGIGQVGSIACGDALQLFLKLDAAGERIVDVRFQTFGCASAIASASALTELAKGRTRAEAAQITNQDIIGLLGELPEAKIHCSVMGMEALQAALADVRKRRREPDPAPTPAVDPAPTVVCHCFEVTEAVIRDVIRRQRPRDLDALAAYCQAGSGCGGCRPELEELLKEERLKPENTTSAPEDKR